MKKCAPYLAGCLTSIALLLWWFSPPNTVLGWEPFSARFVRCLIEQEEPISVEWDIDCFSDAEVEIEFEHYKVSVERDFLLGWRHNTNVWCKRTSEFVVFRSPFAHRPLQEKWGICDKMRRMQEEVDRREYETKQRGTALMKEVIDNRTD